MRNAALETVCLTVIALGVVTALGAWPPTEAPMRLFVDLVFWPLDGAQSLAAPETRALCGVAGGLTVGWGASLLVAARRLAASEPETLRRIVITGVAAWCALDSLSSMVAGAPFNALANLALAAAIIAPVARAARPTA